MSRTRLLALSGSVREGSYNQRLVDLAAGYAREAGAEVTSVRLDEFDLPLYDPTRESNAFPEGARQLKAHFASHEGFLIATPEHNGSVSTVLKNTIDWVSRSIDDEPPLALTGFRGKIAGLMSASPSPFGGLRSVTHLRQILGTVQALVVTEQVCVPFADKAFDGADLPNDLLKQIMSALVSRVIQLSELHNR
jgi:NAD(P)H-dependent FMN reductase